MATAQTNMTARLANPYFEKNLDGWVSDGMFAQGNDAFELKSGNIYCEKWTGTGGTVGNASILQTVADLPVGSYTLTAVGQNIQQDKPTTQQKGVYIVANSSKTPVGVAGEYTVTSTIFDGTTPWAWCSTERQATTSP